MIWPLAGYTLGWLPAWVAIAALVVEILIRLIAIGVIPGGRRPSTAMAWLLGVFLIPVVALPLFAVLGTNRLSARRKERQRLVNEELTGLLVDTDDGDLVLAHNRRLRATVDMNRRLGAFPMHLGNELRLISDYEETFAWMVEAIDEAEQYVHLVFYMISDDPDYAGPVWDALERATARGVSVRVLYDHVGTAQVRGYRALRRRLARSGIESAPSLPLRVTRRRPSRPDLRNHRKIMVVDGRRALTGSTNLIEPHYRRRSAARMGRRWVELNMVCTGPAVTALDLVFASDWFMETDDDLRDVVGGEIDPARHERVDSAVQVLPSGPGYPDENNLRLFNDLIYRAVDRVVICTPYFVPDDSLLYSVTSAVKRGVDVTLVICQKADQVMIHHAQQSYLEELLEAGVRILRYPAPDVLHSKVVVVDRDILAIGSSNMDMRSFSQNGEVTLMVLDPEVVRATDEVLKDYEARSNELDLARWRARPWYEKYLDNAFRLLSGLL